MVTVKSSASSRACTASAVSDNMRPWADTLSSATRFARSCRPRSIWALRSVSGGVMLRRVEDFPHWPPGPARWLQPPDPAAHADDGHDQAAAEQQDVPEAVVPRLEDVRLEVHAHHAR